MNENETVVIEQVKTTENFEETAGTTKTVNENFEETHTDAVEQPLTFSSTYKEKREAIDNALPHIHEADNDGVVHDVYFWICDFDDTYVFVEKCEYKRESGYTEVKGRYAYTFNEADKTATISGDFEEMFVKWLTKDELDQLEAQRAQYEELVAYKAARVQAEHEAEIDAAIGEFSDLEGNEEFATVVANKYSYESVDALRDACYIVRGKSSKPAPQRKSTGDVSVPVGTHIEPDVYEGFFARYGKRK